MDPYFRSGNSFFFSLITPWATWCAKKATLNSDQLMLSGSSWAST
jgi:hypothetical protein